MRANQRISWRPDVLGALGVVACLQLLGGCDGCGEPQATNTDEGPAAPEVEEAPPVGTLRGTVRLAPGASLPVYSADQMEKRLLDHAKRGPWPDECTPPKQVDRQPVRVGGDGGLSGLVIAASEFSRPQRRPQRVHEVLIQDCRLQPRLVSAMVGDALRVKNEVQYPFMPSFGNEPQLRTLTPGQTYDVKLDKPGVTPVLCGFTAPCGRTDVVVMTHPLSAVTDQDGRFVMEGFPAGEKIKLSAWHPLFQEANLEVELEAGEEREVELVIAPLTTAPALPAPDAGAGGAEGATAPAAGEAQKAAEPAAPDAPAAPEAKPAPDAKTAP